MQTHAALRGTRADLGDRGGAMDREMAAVEYRVRHRRVAENGRTVIARQELRPERTARRPAEAGRDRPSVKVFAVDHDGHLLPGLVDRDDDLGPGATGWQHRHSK